MNLVKKVVLGCLMIIGSGAVCLAQEKESIVLDQSSGNDVIAVYDFVKYAVYDFVPTAEHQYKVIVKACEEVKSKVEMTRDGIVMFTIDDALTFKFKVVGFSSDGTVMHTVDEFGQQIIFTTPEIDGEFNLVIENKNMVTRLMSVSQNCEL